ncbi:MAG: hypothetical protein U0414_18650 [Polyangiaceae bacterium]
MSKHPGEVDRTNYITVRPAITRAFWTAKRTWNGAQIGLVVETRWVPDGAALELAIVADRGVATPIEELSAKVQGNRCTLKHKLEWTHAQLANVPIDGLPTHFHFIARVPKFGLELRSNALYVDLGGWSHSS